MTRRPRVAVVGGGITGLVAAHWLVTSALAPEVVLMEADRQIGGKLRTSPFAGHPGIDEGPDAFLARLPWATAHARLVGLGDTLVAPESGRAAVWWDQLHDIPQGLLLGMPTDLMGMARSHLLSWRGKFRAATEPFRRRTALTADSLGGFVRARFGSEVHLRLVDPLVGSIYAADTDRFSLAAVPQIAELAGRSRSVLLAARHTPASPPAPDAGPVFWAPREGMGRLAAATADAFTSSGGTLRSGTAVQRLEADGGGWRIDDEHFDAVVLACPASATADLLRPSDDASADALIAIPAADVAMVTLAVPASQWPERLLGMSGYLVPKPKQRLVTAASFGSQKWSHWSVEGSVVLRVSLGRDGLPVLQHDDDTLLHAAVTEVGQHLGLDLQPTASRITRWSGAFPQYRPHHARAVASIQQGLPAGVVLAGASYHGIGVPTCVRSAQAGAAAVLRHLDPATPAAPRPVAE